MKIRINKILKQGKYFVYVEVNEFSLEDVEKMQRFGVPNIDFSPRSTWHKNKIVNSLPLNEIKDVFVFNNSLAADSFATTMRVKISIAIRRLRNLRDNFSDSKEYEL